MASSSPLSSPPSSQMHVMVPQHSPVTPAQEQAAVAEQAARLATLPHSCPGSMTVAQIDLAVARMKTDMEGTDVRILAIQTLETRLNKIIGRVVEIEKERAAAASAIEASASTSTSKKDEKENVNSGTGMVTRRKSRLALKEIDNGKEEAKAEGKVQEIKNDAVKRELEGIVKETAEIRGMIEELEKQIKEGDEGAEWARKLVDGFMKEAEEKDECSEKV